MISVSEIRLIDLMPESIRNDEQVIYACEAIQPDLDELTRLVSFADLYGNIDNLPEGILRALAWENQMFDAEWAMAGTIEKRRELVKNSYLLNKLRGTKWSLIRLFEVMGLHAEIVEWWEDNSNPFTFRISVLDITGVGLTDEMSQWIDTLVNAYKPLTRHITETNVYRKLDTLKTKSMSAVKINQFFTV